MAKPTSLPRWATAGGALVTEPTEGQKDSGWAPLQKPPAQYFNFWQRLVYLWCVYLDGLTNEVLTWAAKHTFQAGLASDVAPVGLTDVVRKSELDAEEGARAAGDAAESAARSAADATEAGLRAAGDAATLAGAQAYADAKFPAIAWSQAGLSPNANFTWGTGNLAPGYWKDASGVVHLKGQFIAATAPSSTLCSGALPPGWIPGGFRRVTISSSGGPTRAVITNTGVIGLEDTSVVGQVYYLDGISFVAEQ